MKTRGAKKDLSPPKIKPRKNHHKSHKPNNSNKIIIALSFFFIGTQVWDLLHLSLEKAAEL